MTCQGPVPKSSLWGVFLYSKEGFKTLKDSWNNILFTNETFQGPFLFDGVLKWLFLKRYIQGLGDFRQTCCIIFWSLDYTQPGVFLGAPRTPKHVVHVKGPAARKILSIHKPFFCFVRFSLVLAPRRLFFLVLPEQRSLTVAPRAHARTRTFITLLVPQRANTPVCGSKSQQHEVSPCCLYASAWSSDFRRGTVAK